MKKYHNSSKLLLTIALALVLSMSFVISTPVTALAKVTYVDSSKSKAKTKRYYSDVKKKTTYCSEIEWLARRGAFKGIAKKGKKFSPNKILTRRELGTVLDNLYKNKINLTIKNPKAKVTQKYLTDTLEITSKQLGYCITWNGGSPKAKVSRANACYLIRAMMKSVNGKLDP